MERTIIESQLLEKVKNSDMEAFRVLFERYQPVIFRHIMFYTRRKDVANDIVQETFISVWEHRASLKPDLSFLSYILRISGNLVRDYVKHVKTRERLEDRLPRPALSKGDDPEEALHFTILQNRIHSIIGTCSSEKLPRSFSPEQV